MGIKSRGNYRVNVDICECGRVKENGVCIVCQWHERQDEIDRRENEER